MIEAIGAGLTAGLFALVAYMIVRGLWDDFT